MLIGSENKRVCVCVVHSTDRHNERYKTKLYMKKALMSNNLLVIIKLLWKTNKQKHNWVCH